MFEQLAGLLSKWISDFFDTNMFDYWLGVFFAIFSGIENFLGSVLQKKVVNEVSDDAKFFRSLIKKPLWLLGLILQMGVGSAFFFLAQIYIGPTLVPGLMASGLIVLAIGSLKIIREELNLSEIIGIILMIVAIALIGFSNLNINIIQQNYLEAGFLIRLTFFTVILFALAGICKILEMKQIQMGISLAVLSGIMFALTNFWIAPLMGLIVHVFRSDFLLLELIIFVVAAIILILTNIIGLGTIQQSFKHAQASNMIPLQQVPVQIAPPLYYFIVYFLPLPNIFSLIFITSGISLVIVCIFLLSRRQAELEKIQ